jgi:DNA-binding PadR family transcriptional regulator
MKEAKTKSKNELLPGTLEMLILKTLSIESMHGYGIAQHIQMLSSHVLTIEEGSLYPALQRIARQGMGAGRVEDLGEQPASALLQAHDCGEDAARCRGNAILPDVRRDHARAEDDVAS